MNIMEGVGWFTCAVLWGFILMDVYNWVSKEIRARKRPLPLPMQIIGEINGEPVNIDSVELIVICLTKDGKKRYGLVRLLVEFPSISCIMRRQGSAKYDIVGNLLIKHYFFN